MENSTPFVSIIIPVRNEGSILGKCLESIQALDYPKDKIEIIVADGVSGDNSRQIAVDFGAVVVENERKIVASGRNSAFKIAKGEIIAFTDADCRLDKNWLKEALKYFNDAAVAGVGGPNFTPDEESDFGKAVGFVFGERIFAGGSTYARAFKTVQEVRALPGCNAIYRRAVLDKVMPQDETLLTCDDVEMNKKITDSGYKLLYTPDVYVWHYRRPTFRKLFKQVYRFSIGRVQLKRRDAETSNFAHIFVGVHLPVYVIVSVLLYIINKMLFVIFNLLAVGFLLFFFVYSYVRNKSWKQSFYVPFIILIIAIAWSLGFLRETFFSMRDVAGK